MTPDEQSAKLESIVEYAKMGMSIDKEAYIAINRAIVEPLSYELERTLTNALEIAGVAASVRVEVRWRGPHFLICWTPMRTMKQQAQMIEEQFINRGLPW